MRRLALLPLVAVALAVAGCGHNDSSDVGRIKYVDTPPSTDPLAASALLVFNDLSELHVRVRVNVGQNAHELTYCDLEPPSLDTLRRAREDGVSEAKLLELNVSC